jgi:hypothetical protein
MHTPETCDDNNCKQFACKLYAWRTGGLRLSMAATPSRTPSKAPPRAQSPSWEAGIPTDSRGMPYLDQSLEPLTQKEFVNNRHKIEAAKRERHNRPAMTQEI